MNFFMTVKTQSYSVIQVKSLVGMSAPFPDVMSMKRAAQLAAVLAGVFVALEYCLSPDGNPPTIPTIIGALFALMLYVAFPRTVSLSIFEKALLCVKGVSAVGAFDFLAGARRLIMAFFRTVEPVSVVDKSSYGIKIFAAKSTGARLARLSSFAHARIRAKYALSFSNLVWASIKSLAASRAFLPNEFALVCFIVATSGTEFALAAAQVASRNVKRLAALGAFSMFALELAFCFAFIATVFSLTIPNSRRPQEKTLTTYRAGAIGFLLGEHLYSKKGAPSRLGALAEGTPFSPLGGMKKAPVRFTFPQQVNYTMHEQAR
jgi:hypothetical protein